MKNLVTSIATATLVMIASSAQAHHIYKYKEVCKDVQVPIYGNVTTSHRGSGNAGEGALGGMIIGGVLGKVIGGNDKGAAAGAILGGVIGADKSQENYTTTKREVIGYETKTRCHTVKTRIEKPVNRTGTVVSVYRTRSHGGEKCIWVNQYIEGTGWRDVQQCTTRPTGWVYTLTVDVNGVLWTDTTTKDRNLLGRQWNLTKDAYRR